MISKQGCFVVFLVSRCMTLRPAREANSTIASSSQGHDKPIKIQLSPTKLLVTHHYTATPKEYELQAIDTMHTPRQHASVLVG